MFDKDGSGRITKSEMESALISLGMETDKQRYCIRGSQRDVVYLGWPIASSYMSPNAGGGVVGFQPMSTVVHLEPK
jgi:hypothetical protein